ncbi:hypothetical protein EDC01DRAFT_162796 [Geopyxis carbonaria]|nr:hypothetical protein EDC01DRAFT_162796 [Geopyxis carbonaria]
MSSTYSSPSVKAVEQRIYSLSINGDSTETISTTSLPRPPPRALNPTVPRIRILLAPYMSPYVVPLHKVRTWDSLHQTLHSLFGPDVFNGSELRITDYKGNTILPAIWQDLLEPNITIIVDTCAYIPESSPIIFEGRGHYPPTKGYGQRERGKRTNQQYKKHHHHKNMEQYTGEFESQDGTYGDLESATAMILAERESEDSSYENANMISPLGHIGQAALTAPLGSLKSRPVQHAWEGWATDATPPPVPTQNIKRNTSVSMFAGKRGRREQQKSEIFVGNREKQQPIVEMHEEQTIESLGFITAEAKEVGYTNTITSGNPQLVGRTDSLILRQKKKKPRKSLLRLARIILLAFSGNSHSKSGHEHVRPTATTDELPKRSQTVSARKPEPMATPQLPKHASLGHSATRNASISKRRGVPTLPPVHPGRMTFDFPFAATATATATAEVRHSRSLNSLIDAARQKPTLINIPATGNSLTRRHSKLGSLTRSESHKERNLLRKHSTSASTSHIRKESVISPPIPRRPQQELGIIAQFKTPHLDRATIQELATNSHAANGIYTSGLDGSTLGSSRSRGGSDASTAVAEDQNTPEKKPLPKLPYKFSAFPPRSPPRSPVPVLRVDGKIVPPRLPQADRRPSGTRPIFERKKTKVSESIKRFKV